MVLHTDDGNAARLEHLPVERIEAKHFRWHAEITQGGSLLLYRAGTGTLHKVPDGLSRNPPSRDELILARAGEWARHRAAIRGVEDAMDRGEFDDEEPELYQPEKLQKLKEEQQKAWTVFRTFDKPLPKSRVKRSRVPVMLLFNCMVYNAGLWLSTSLDTRLNTSS